LCTRYNFKKPMEKHEKAISDQAGQFPRQEIIL